jgi:hypothetical protein
MEFVGMSRDDPKQRAAFAAFEQSAKELESTAVEVVHAGHACSRRENRPTLTCSADTASTKRVEAALAVPAGLKRVAALHAAMMASKLQ